MYNLSDFDENDFDVVVDFYPLQKQNQFVYQAASVFESFSPRQMHQIPISIYLYTSNIFECLNEEFRKKILPENNCQERQFLLSQKKLKVVRRLTSSKLGDKYTRNT